MCRRWLNQLEQWVQVGDVDGFNFSYYASLPGGLEVEQTGRTAMHPESRYTWREDEDVLRYARES